MKALKSITLMALATAEIAISACKSTEKHWHRTTKAEKQQKKNM